MKKRLSIFLLLGVFIFSATIASYPVFGVDDDGCMVNDASGKCLDQYYLDQDILRYDPRPAYCSPDFDAIESGLTSTVNKNYLGGPILTEAEITAISENYPVYKKAADAADIPWQILAAIHYRESHFKREGLEDKTGPYNLAGTDQPVGEYDDTQFSSATDVVAGHIREVFGEDYDFSSTDNIKSVFFTYNGAQEEYKDQAIDLDFTERGAERGEGSPYVMNRADLKRDSVSEPTKSGTTWGQIKTAGSALTYPATSDYGAFIIYSVLANIGSDEECGPSEGGMTLEQAQEFMAKYKQIDAGDPNGDMPFMSGTIGCSGLRTNNCVAFTLFFLQKYTTLNYASEDGGKIVGAIAAANPDIQSGTVPQAYSIFGTRKGRTICEDGLPCGHTGIVLGVDTARGVIIVGEAAYCNDSFTGAREYSIESWSNGEYTYLYAAEFLNEERSGDLN